MSSNFLILYLVYNDEQINGGHLVTALLTILLRINTGPNDRPSVQQQHKQPNSKYFTLNGMLLTNRMFT